MYVEGEGFSGEGAIGVENRIIAFLADLYPAAPAGAFHLLFIFLEGRVAIDQVSQLLVDKGGHPPRGSSVELYGLLGLVLSGADLHLLAGEWAVDLEGGRLGEGRGGEGALGE